MLTEILDRARHEIWLVAAILILFYVSKVFTRKKGNMPPGPIGLPIVGYLPFLTKYPHLKFTKLAKKYGDVFSLYMGSELVIVLNSADAIREAFGKREFLGRPPNTSFSIFNIKTPFLSTDFHMWQEQRRFVVQSMKDLGLGNSKIEGHLQEEILYFLDILKESKGQPMDLIKPLTPSMSNNICSLVFGERYEYSNPIRIAMDNALEIVGNSIGQTAGHIFFPWLRKLPFISRFFKYEKARKAFQINRDYFNEQIRIHKETLDPKDKRDFIDSYLLEMKSRSVKDQKTTFSESALEGTVANLFGAGSETVRTSISWCMYVMAAYPEIQMKVRREIHDVLGTNTFPQFLDQKNLPYTQAVIREIMRWQTLVPINLLRYTLDDATVRGYDIPKNTVVIANFYSVHHDVSYWKDPENFRPERFIDSDGSVLKTNYFMPFSVGKRACPGEAMAMMEVFLYFVAILQKFEVTFPEGFEPTFEAELGITYRLKHHKICFISK